MSSETQFLLVTHSKRMMTAADLIYGVTMQEPGVSKLVSVRLAGEEIPPAAAANKLRNVVWPWPKCFRGCGISDSGKCITQG